MAVTKESVGKVINRILAIAAFVVIITVSAVVMTQKESFFLDEYSAFSCANSTHGKKVEIQNGITYEEPMEVWLDTFGAQEGSTFSYAHVWENMSENCHPPLFYVCLHFVSSLFPGTLSKWYGYAVNIVFAVICLFFLRKIAKKVSDSELTANIIALSFAACLGVTAQIVLIRMYTMAMCVLTMAVWELLCILDGDTSRKTFVKLILCSILCALTHYYCIIGLAFSCGVLCIILLIHKQRKTVLHICFAEAIAAVVSVAVFPAMVVRMFTKGRGKEAVSGLAHSTMSDLIDTFRDFGARINRNLFGSTVLWLLVLAIVLIVIWLVAVKKKCKKLLPEKSSRMEEIAFFEKIALFILPALAYVLLISKFSISLTTTRYMSPVFPMLFLGVFCCLQHLLTRIAPKSIAAVIMAVICLFVSARSWQTGTVEYLYTGSTQQRDEMLGPYEGSKLLVFWKGSVVNDSLVIKRLPYFDSVTCYWSLKLSNTQTIDALENGENVVVMIYKTQRTKVLDWLQEMYPMYQVKKLDSSSDNTFRHYYFYRDQE